jgi:SHS2 domain-containing protein
MVGTTKICEASSMPNAKYEFLPHTTDAYIEARGETFEQALEAAGLALFDTMCDINSVSHELTDELQASGSDEIRLLYDWLERLLLKFELEGKVYSRFKVASIAKSPDTLHTTARMFGEKYDRKKHGSKVEVKAVTYHKMEILKDKSGVALRFILDL